MMEKIKSPQYRFSLRGRIHEAGFRTMSQLAERVGVDKATLSRVVNGWELPGPTLQRNMARALGLTLRELTDLL